MLKVDQNQIFFSVDTKCLFGRKKICALASLSLDPWQLEKKCQDVEDTIDYAESQSVEKTIINENVRIRCSGHMHFLGLNVL